ncbi:MAG: hypothetical protein M3439_09240 [Chloroflexota bacterium]|nr:hypothetical protein [Chloroflexota bacterium]
MEEQLDGSCVEPGFYRFHELVRDVLSPGAVGTLEQLTARILEIYGLAELLDRQLPAALRDEHAEQLVTRVRRVVRLLPADVSPMPNEVFTAIEFLLYEIDGEPIRIGEAIMRLEILADEIRARPLLHDMLMGRAN